MPYRQPLSAGVAAVIGVMTSVGGVKTILALRVAAYLVAHAGVRVNHLRRGIGGVFCTISATFHRLTRKWPRVCLKMWRIKARKWLAV